MVPLSLEPIDDRQTYSDVVSRLPITSPLQTWAYGQAREVLGQQPLRFLLLKDGAVVGATQLLRKQLGPGFTTLYAPRGPALDSLDLLPEFAVAVKRVARRSDVYLRIEPSVPIPAGDSAQQTSLLTEQRVIPARLGPFSRAQSEQPEHTLLADLTVEEDTLFEGLHKMARRNVRTAQRAGVVVRREEDFEAFWEIFEATNDRAQLGSFPKAYYTTLLREAALDGTAAYLILSRHEGRALAGGLFLGTGGSTCYLYGGSVRDDRPPTQGDKRKDVKAPDAFYWGAMKDAKEHGYHSFDFWGIPRVLDESRHSYGVFKMKLKFSTQRYWYPAYDLRLSPLAPAVRTALRARRNVLNYRSRGTTADIL